MSTSASMEKMTNQHGVSAIKPEGTTQKTYVKWKDSVKIDLKGTG
jgi:hypothetical protein